MGTASMVQAPQVFFSPLERGLAVVDGLDDCGGRDDFCPGPCFRFAIKAGSMWSPWMSVSKNQVGLRQACEDGGFGWINHYDFCRPLR